MGPWCLRGILTARLMSHPLLTSFKPIQIYSLSSFLLSCISFLALKLHAYFTPGRNWNQPFTSQIQFLLNIYCVSDRWGFAYLITHGADITVRNYSLKIFHRTGRFGSPCFQACDCINYSREEMERTKSEKMDGWLPVFRLSGVPCEEREQFCTLGLL